MKTSYYSLRLKNQIIGIEKKYCQSSNRKKLDVNDGLTINQSYLYMYERIKAREMQILYGLYF